MSEVKRFEWTEFWSNREVKYIQGAYLNAGLPVLNRKLSNNARTIQKKLSRHFIIKNDVIEFPFLIVGFTPYYKLIFLQGDEALRMLNLFRPFHLLEPPLGKDMGYIIASKDIFRMIQGFPPTIQEIIETNNKREKFGNEFWTKKGVRQSIKNKLYLRKCEELFPLI